jgi:hypothetical protein
MKNPFIQKKYSHSRKYGNRINPLSIGIALVIGLLWCCTPGQYDDTYIAVPEKTEVKVVAQELTKEDIELKIKQYFPKSYKTMIPIAYAESGLNQQAQGFNCFYNKDEIVVYSIRVKGSHSTACKKSHRVYAYSTDCNVLQKNVKGKVCPKQTLDEHLKEVAELSKVQHFNGWSAYNNGSYKKYLANK